MLRILILTIFICTYSFLGAQSIKNEGELIEQADEHFEEGRFLKALPLYSQLVSLYPKSSDYNFRFGTCVIFSGVDRETAIRHLSFSVKRSAEDSRAYYYLGLAYHLNYEFRKAKSNYTEFLKKATDKEKENFNTQRQIQMCANGESLLSNLTDLVVLDKKEVSELDFFRYYNLDEIGGKIIAKPEEFLTKKDKKKGLKGVVHFDRSSDYIFYSSYGKDGDNLDIYRVQPLAGGGFSKPEKLKGDVNTPFDEDYGFLHADGETLYFCSKGHSSMGGYDVFSAVYDVSTDQYLRVKNLDFAVNTPDDDLFYLVDSTRTMAYFASGRSSAMNNLHVYQVRVASVPLKLVIIQGDFIAQFDENLKNSKITIVDEFTSKPVGEFYTDKSNGSYVIPFERPGTYKFSIEAENSAIIHEGIVEIPNHDSAVALRQELILSKENGQEKLQIKNYFDTILDADLAELTQEIMRRKAGLDVNASEMESILEKQLEQDAQKEEPTASDRPVEEAGKVAGFEEGKSNQEIASDMRVMANEFSSKSEKLDHRAREAYAESKIKLSTSEQKFNEGKTLITQSESAEGAEKLELINKGNILLSEAKTAGLEARSLLEVVSSIDTYKTYLKQESDSLSLNADIVDSSSDFKEVLGVLKAEKTRQREVDTTDGLNPETTITDAENFSEKELDNLLVRLEDLREEEKSLSLKIAAKNRSLEAVKKKSEKEALEEEIIQLNAEYTAVQDDIVSESEKVEVLGLDAQNYALQRAYLEKVNSETHQFEGEAISYDSGELSAQISKATSTALEADKLIPEEFEAVASASEELKEKIELKELNTKLGSVSSAIELKSIDQLRSDLALKSVNLVPLNNTAADLARTNALNTQLEKSLDSEIEKIDRAIKLDGFSDEEKSALQSQKQQLLKEKNSLEIQDYLAPEISEERISAVKETYIKAEEDKLNEWTENSSSFSGLTDAEFMALQANEALQNEIDKKTEQIAESNDEEQIIALKNEIEELEAVKNGYETLPFNADFLADVYEEELTDHPNEKLPKAREYKDILEEKIEELSVNDSSSGIKTAQNQDLRNGLELELSLVNGVINKLEATEESEILASEASTANENIEVYKSEFSSAELQDQTRLAAAVLPDYDSNLIEIEKDSGIDEKTRMEDKKLVNSELIDVIDEKIEERVTLMDETSNDSSKEMLQLEINQLSQLKGVKAAENDVLDTQITELEKTLEEEIEIAETNSSTSSDENAGLTQNTKSEESAGANAAAETSEDTIEENSTAEIENLTDQREEGTAEETTANPEEGNPAQENTAKNSENPTIEEQPEPTENLVDENIDEGIPDAALIELSEEEVETEITAMNVGFRNVLVESSSIVEPADFEQLENSEAFENLVMDNPELSNSLKSSAQISGFKNDLEKNRNTPAEDEKAQAKLDKKATKLKKKIAKLELKNSEVLKSTTSKTLEEARAELEANLLEKNTILTANQPYAAAVSKLVQKADVLEEDAEIHEDLADVTQRDILAESEQRNKALASNLAAIENLEKANWMLKNSADIAKLSPQALEKLVSGEYTAPEEFEETEEILAEESIEEKELKELSSFIETKPSAEELMSTWELTETEAEILKNSPALVEYQTKSKAIESKVDEIEALETELTALTAEALTTEQMADKLEAQKETATPERQAQLDSEIKKLRAFASVAYETANQKLETQQELISETSGLREELEAIADSMTKDSALSSAELAASAETITSNASAEDLYNQSLDMSNAAEKTIFAKTKNVYSNDRPIPVDVDLPEGLVYKVQVGAFRNAIPQNLYNEFAPVTGEKLNNGITRYSAGLFTSESSANSAKRDIRGIGFEDAFVVAYLNGERISLAQARNLNPEDNILADTGESALQSDTTSNVSELQTSNQDTDSSLAEPNALNSNPETETESSTGQSNTVFSSQSTESQNSEPDTFNPTETADDYYKDFPDAAAANQVEVLKGLFYTVQVGVYSQPVAANKIYNISPLNSERLSNGTIRYTSGIYNNLEQATARKQEIQALGVTDAFITAYYNGQKITISAAKAKFQEEGIEVLEVSNQVAEAASAETAENTAYVIFIGSFTDKVPASVAKAMLFLEDSRGIVKKQEGDKVSYYTKAVNSRATAEIIKQEFESYGVDSVQIQEVK